MSVPKKRKNKSAVRTKRSHHSLKKRKLVVCPHCQKKIIPHHACPFCGYYKGREAVLIKLKKDKKKKEKEKDKKKK